MPKKVNRFSVPLHAHPKKSIRPPSAKEKEKFSKKGAEFVVRNHTIEALVHHRPRLMKELEKKTISVKLAREMMQYELRAFMIRKMVFFPGELKRNHEFQRQLIEYPFYELHFLKMEHALELGEKPSKKSVINMIDKLERLKAEFDLMHPRMPSNQSVPSLLRAVIRSAKSPQHPAFKKLLLHELREGVRHANSLFFAHLKLGGRDNFLQLMESDRYVRTQVIPLYLR